MAIFFVGISIFLMLLFLNYLFGGENLLRCSFGSAGLGVGAMLAVNLTGLFTGVSLPLSLLTIGTSLAGGPAGLASLLILQTWYV